MCEDENMEENTGITNDQATTWAQDNKTIMAPEGSVDHGRIADSPTAQRMANFENITHDPNATDTDKELATKAESTIEAVAEVDASGLTSEQKKFVEAIESVNERHPGVLEVEVEENQKFWKIKNYKTHEMMFFSKNGVYNINLEKNTDDINILSLTKITDQLDMVPEKHMRFISGSVSKDLTVYNMGFSLNAVKLNLDDENEKRWLSNAIALGDNLVREEAEETQKVGASVDVLNAL